MAWPGPICHRLVAALRSCVLLPHVKPPRQKCSNAIPHYAANNNATQHENNIYIVCGQTQTICQWVPVRGQEGLSSHIYMTPATCKRQCQVHWTPATEMARSGRVSQEVHTVERTATSVNITQQRWHRQSQVSVVWHQQGGGVQGARKNCRNGYEPWWHDDEACLQACLPFHEFFRAALLMVVTQTTGSRISHQSVCQTETN